MPYERQHRQHGRGIHPSPPVFIPPLARREVQYPPRERNAEIDGLVRESLCLPMRHVGRQRAIVDTVKRELAYERHQRLKQVDIIFKRYLVLVVEHVLCPGLIERPLAARAEELCLPQLLEFANQPVLRFSKILAETPAK